jgi:hypothetical protein
MMIKNILAAALAGVCVLTASASTTSKAAGQQIKNNFRRPQVASLKALKATIGKPFDAGWLFIDGQFVEPPYKVERYGTVLRVNGFQITNDVVPWEEFIKTQEGVVVTKTESAPDSTESAPEPVPEAELEDEEDDDDVASSLDDLFDDEPVKKTTKKKTKKSAGYKLRPKKPTTKVAYSFDGEFVPNEKSNALLARINKARGRIDAMLRAGGIICASSKYSYIRVDGGPVADQAMEKLPGIMKAAKTPEDLLVSARNAGMVFFSSPFCADLYRNRFTYLRLEERCKSIKEKKQWQSLGL